MCQVEGARQEQSARDIYQARRSVRERSVRERRRQWIGALTRKGAAHCQLCSSVSRSPRQLVYASLGDGDLGRDLIDDAEDRVEFGAPGAQARGDQLEAGSIIVTAERDDRHNRDRALGLRQPGDDELGADRCHRQRSRGPATHLRSRDARAAGPARPRRDRARP